jgi:hypothetical protein
LPAIIALQSLSRGERREREREREKEREREREREGGVGRNH